MRKRTFICLIVLTSCLLNNNLKAQTPVKDTATYEYAILTMYGNNLTVVFEWNQAISYIDLDKKLNCDTMTGNKVDRYYRRIFQGVNFMDKMGYELVASSVSRLDFKEYVFRKKRNNN